MARRLDARGFLTASVVVGSLIWSTNALAGSYEVKPGDSLWALAKRHGVRVEAIQEANALAGDKIRQGQVLTIPGKTQPRKAATSQQAPAPAPKPARRGVGGDAAKPAAPAASTTTRPAAAVRTSSNPTARPKPEPASRSRDKSATVYLKASEAASQSMPARGADRKSLDAAERLYSSELTPPPSTLEEIAPAWVLERPGPSTQGEKSEAARGGVYPCVAPDPGFGKYSKWVQVAPMAHVLSPRRMSLDEEGRFDVLFHFHGREPIRKEWVKVMDSAVLVAIDIGIDSGAYATAYSDPRTFSSVLQAVELEVARQAGAPRASVGRVALSSWSAGFGAVERILSQPVGRQLVDSVILLDGLHSGYVGQSLDAERLAPFVGFAQQASLGRRLLFVSHSSILTTGYASTTETANYLVWRVGGRPRSAEPLKADPMGLERLAVYTSGDFHVRGFRGSGSSDHCAHLGLMRDVLRVHLAPRWAEPRDVRVNDTGAVAETEALEPPEQRLMAARQDAASRDDTPSE